MEGEEHTTAQDMEQPGKRPPWWKRLWGWSEFGEKTGWEWMQLLIVPIVLAAAGFWFTTQQNARQQDIEDQRAERAREIEEQRAQDAALQAYLDQMSTLIIEKKLGSPDEADGAVRSAARARTLTVLPRLDGHRKYSVLLFLAESGLISEDSHIVWLVGADLSNLEVKSRANLGWNLSRTVLHGTDLSNADLHSVLLQESSLSNTDLSGADLRGADLSGADLTDAVLTDAVLTGVKGITNEELESQARSLEGATMPDGSKHP